MLENAPMLQAFRLVLRPLSILFLLLFCSNAQAISLEEVEREVLKELNQIPNLQAALNELKDHPMKMEGPFCVQAVMNAVHRLHSQNDATPSLQDFASNFHLLVELTESTTSPDIYSKLTDVIERTGIRAGPAEHEFYNRARLFEIRIKFENSKLQIEFGEGLKILALEPNKRSSLVQRLIELNAGDEDTAEFDYDNTEYETVALIYLRMLGVQVGDLRALLQSQLPHRPEASNQDQIDWVAVFETLKELWHVPFVRNNTLFYKTLLELKLHTYLNEREVDSIPIAFDQSPPLESRMTVGKSTSQLRLNSGGVKTQIDGLPNPAIEFIGRPYGEMIEALRERHTDEMNHLSEYFFIRTSDPQKREALQEGRPLIFIQPSKQSPYGEGLLATVRYDLLPNGLYLFQVRVKPAAVIGKDIDIFNTSSGFICVAKNSNAIHLDDHIDSRYFQRAVSFALQEENFALAIDLVEQLRPTTIGELAVMLKDITTPSLSFELYLMERFSKSMDLSSLISEGDRKKLQDWLKLALENPDAVSDKEKSGLRRFLELGYFKNTPLGKNLSAAFAVESNDLLQNEMFASNQNKLLSRIERLHRLLSLNAPTEIIQNECRMLSESLDQIWPNIFSMRSGIGSAVFRKNIQEMHEKLEFLWRASLKTAGFKTDSYGPEIKSQVSKIQLRLSSLIPDSLIYFHDHMTRKFRMDASTSVESIIGFLNLLNSLRALSPEFVENLSKTPSTLNSRYSWIQIQKIRASLDFLIELQNLWIFHASPESARLRIPTSRRKIRWSRVMQITHQLQNIKEMAIRACSGFECQTEIPKKFLSAAAKFLDGVMLNPNYQELVKVAVERESSRPLGIAVRHILDLRKKIADGPTAGSEVCTRLVAEIASNRATLKDELIP